MTQPTPPLAEWLTAACQKRELSWAEASRRAGLHQGAISAYVRGKQPGLDACKALSSFFQVPLEYVLQLAGHADIARSLSELPPELRTLVHDIEQLPEPLQRAVIKAWRAVLEGIQAGRDLQSEPR